MSFTLVFLFLKTICKDNLSALLFLCVILTNTFVLNEMLSLEWNVQFSLFFHFLVFIFLYQWIEEKKDYFLTLLGITIGLGLQVHHSVLFHLITLSVFLITSDRFQNSIIELQNLFKPLKEEKDQMKVLTKDLINWRYIFSFFCFILLPQIPYLIGLITKRVYFLTPQSERILIHIHDFFLNFLENFKGGDPLYLNFQQFNIIIFCCIVICVYRLKTEKINFSESISNMMLICICPLLLGFIFPNLIYFLSFFILIIFLKWHDDFWPKDPAIKFLFFLIYGLSISVSFGKNLFLSKIILMQILGVVIFVGCYFYNKKYKLSLIRLKIISLIVVFSTVFYNGLMIDNFTGKMYQFKKIMETIYTTTGWTSEEALNRIFSVGFIAKKSVSFSYHLAMEEIGSVKPIKSSKHGYFIISKKSFKNYMKKCIDCKVEDYLLSGFKVPKEIKQELHSKALTIDWFQDFDHYLLYSYQIRHNSRFPKGFHNVSISYNKPDEFKEICNSSGLYKKNQKVYLCYLSKEHSLQDIVMILNFYTKDSKKTFIKVEIHGLPLSMNRSDRGIYHALIKDIKVEINCNKKDKINILSAVGLDDIVKSNFHKSIFTPLTVVYPVKCSVRTINKLILSFKYKKGWTSEIKQESFFIKL